MLIHFLKPAIHIIGLALFFATASVAQTLQVSIMDSEGNPVADAVVELIVLQEAPQEALQVATQQNQAERTTTRIHDIDQIDKEFVPNVTAITAGEQVSFPNSDDILHHVYSFSSARTFNIPLYGRGDSNDYAEQFPLTGVIEIGCNIHDWMLAYIYVGESDRVAISDQSGIALIQNISPGNYEYNVWHARAAGGEDRQLRSVTIIAGETTVQEVVLELARDRRIRRAPSANRQRYR